jgi:hypothetical protein
MIQAEKHKQEKNYEITQVLSSFIKLTICFSLRESKERSATVPRQTPNWLDH